MKIIEFFGLPYSGKTYFSELIIKKIKKKSYDAKSITLFYIWKKNYFNLYIFLSCIKNNLFSKTKTNYYDFNTSKENKFQANIIKKKILFSSYYKFLKEKQKIFNESKKKYSNFSNLIENILDKETDLYRKKNLKRWFKNELTAIYIAKEKKMSGVLIMSEGLIQRIHSYFIKDKNIDANMIKRYLKTCPLSDTIFFVNTDKKIILSRMEKNKKNKKAIFYLENLNNLEKKLLMIVNEVKNIDSFRILNNEQDLQDLNQL